MGLEVVFFDDMKLNPSDYYLEEDKATYKYNTGDISFKFKGVWHHLITKEEKILIYDFKMDRIVSEVEFMDFQTLENNNNYRITDFSNSALFKDELKNYTENKINEIKVLMNEIYEFHLNNFIDKCLEQKNFEALIKIKHLIK
ncbi:hypothetical protein M3649_03875 [Ureibacillus chungkukjangi]|uniref:hypothetical protein n=1 Tax=Ureibacillus chungkukjangi TaxID=1202712 RepID=UPI00203F0106|nr:hypothetical protein [Ureibacillus chungkukjangi]MCM3387270.1 hypothetical protein [Ureibacillus chungkukjangi]